MVSKCISLKFAHPDPTFEAITAWLAACLWIDICTAKIDALHLVATCTMEAIVAHFVKALSTVQPIQIVLSIRHSTCCRTFLTRQWILLSVNDHQQVAIWTAELFWLANLCLHSSRQINFWARSYAQFGILVFQRRFKGWILGFFVIIFLFFVANYLFFKRDFIWVFIPAMNTVILQLTFNFTRNCFRRYGCILSLVICLPLFYFSDIVIHYLIFVTICLNHIIGGVFAIGFWILSVLNFYGFGD